VIFLLRVPPVALLYSCSFSGRRLDEWRASGPCGRLMMSVSSVVGIPCSLHVWFTYWVAKSFANDTFPTLGMSAVTASAIVTSAAVESQPLRLTTRVRLMTSRCRGPSCSHYRQKSRGKLLKQCLWNFLNISTKTHFIITKNSLLDSAWIAVQQRVILLL